MSQENNSEDSGSLANNEDIISSDAPELKSQGQVAIIGRPNVGKSTLFNIISNTRKAVVKDQPGVTRDIQVELAEWTNHYFDIMDTGGLTEGEGTFNKQIRAQVVATLKTVDLIVVVVDGRDGLHPEDKDVMKLVHEANKPYLIVANKLDGHIDEAVAVAEFYELGENVIAASFERRRNVDEILEWIVKNLPSKEILHKEGVTIAVIGKPNAGKSSLINRILGAERMIVSEVAGTTVDAIDIEIEYKGHQYTLIDTAGQRKQAKRKDDVEILSVYKSKQAVERADIVLLVVDANIGPTEQDAKMIEKVLEDHKGVILVANKCDVAQKEIPAFRQTFKEQVEKNFHFFKDIPVSFISAKTGQGVEELFDDVQKLWELLHTRISTSELNDFFTKVIRLAPSPVWQTRNVSFYYLTQTRQVPPSFIAFANAPEGVDNSYRRFLVNQIKANWNLKGIPIRIFVMKRGGRSL